MTLTVLARLVRRLSATLANVVYPRLWSGAWIVNCPSVHRLSCAYATASVLFNRVQRPRSSLPLTSCDGASRHPIEGRALTRYGESPASQRSSEPYALNGSLMSTAWTRSTHAMPKRLFERILEWQSNNRNLF